MYFVLVAIVVSSCLVAASEEVRKVYHIQGSKWALEKLKEEYPDEMDVWNQVPLESSSLEPLDDITLYATPSFVAKVQREIKLASTMFSVREEAIDVEAMIKQERINVHECGLRDVGIWRNVENPSWTEDPFFDCFRTAEENFAFLDRLVGRNPQFMTKFDISKTIEGRIIPGFKLSSGKLENGAVKPAIFIQGMLHAREWLGPPTVVYSMASILDGLNNVEGARDGVVDMMEQFDFYYVPIVNIDGYRYSWSGDRMWRKNRRLYKKGNVRGIFDRRDGVDLNRNYGPLETFCTAGASKNPGSQTYCGTAPFSEPEIAGIEKFINAHPEIAGAIDVHCFSDLVLRPYGLSSKPIDEPHNGKMKKIGQLMADEINNFDPRNPGKYRSIPASGLYVCTGTFLDSIYESHQQKPSITFELRGDSFIVDPKLIPVSGKEIFSSLQVFAREVAAY